MSGSPMWAASPMGTGYVYGYPAQSPTPVSVQMPVVSSAAVAMGGIRPTGSVSSQPTSQAATGTSGAVPGYVAPPAMQAPTPQQQVAGTMPVYAPPQAIHPPAPPQPVSGTMPVYVPPPAAQASVPQQVAAPMGYQQTMPLMGQQPGVSAGPPAVAAQGVAATQPAMPAMAPAMPFAGYWPGQPWGYPPMYAAMQAVPPPAVQPRPAKKKLRVPKFKGRDSTVSITAWLKMLQAEVKRQTTTEKVNWTSNDVFNAATTLLDGDAMEWYSSLDGTLSPEEETIENLATMLREQYMISSTEPETIARLNQRRQGRGETLTDFAQNLRMIVAGRGIDEKWLVNAFLNGMSNQINATHVRVALGREQGSLREAVQAAVQHTGEFGEGTLTNLMGAETAYDARQGQGAVPMAVVQGGAQQSAVASGRDSGVSTQGTWGLPNPRAPRYDTDGRLVGSMGNKTESEWWKNVPPGFKIVPDSVGGQSSARSGQKRTDDSRSPRADGSGSSNRRPGKAMKVEGQANRPAFAAPSTEAAALPNREERLRNYRRYQDSKGRPSFVPRAQSPCFYCQRLGHFARDCELRKKDLESEEKPAAANGATGQDQNRDSGNEQQV